MEKADRLVQRIMWLLCRTIMSATLDSRQQLVLLVSTGATGMWLPIAECSPEQAYFQAMAGDCVLHASPIRLL